MPADKTLHVFSYSPFSWELLAGVVSGPPPGSLPIPSFNQKSSHEKRDSRCSLAGSISENVYGQVCRHPYTTAGIPNLSYTTERNTSMAVVQVL